MSDGENTSNLDGLLKDSTANGKKKARFTDLKGYAKVLREMVAEDIVPDSKGFASKSVSFGRPTRVKEK